MKKFLLSLVAAFYASTAIADISEYGPGDILTVNMGGVCVTNGPSYFDYTVTEFGVKPLFMANVKTKIIAEGKPIDREGVLVVLSNQDTGIVKVAVLYPEGVICEIFSGINFEPYVN